MTVDTDPQELQRIEHKQKLLNERLSQCLAKQNDLQQEEGKLRTELTHLENDKYRILSH